jgi:hypothetical protein
MSFLHEPRRVSHQLVALDARQGEGVAGIVDRRTHQRVDALAHQSRIRSKHEED